MMLIAVLDEAIVRMDVSLALSLTAMPAAWLLALGLAAVGLVLLGARGRIRMQAILAAILGGSTRMAVRPAEGARSEILAGTVFRPAGARGARSPGRGPLRSPLHG
ncbi:hypothetical protein ACIPY5_17180 [Microbacterium sp. NPDC089698]|uniref:hypothetical protein n=1 Tax=unclassified Microbacterium TaxID=2609290 RepID=UPI002821B676|nr:hypothetical protein [Microbacterium sp.]MDR2323140.1 hypothetical protein [Microbacterium sp.]